MPQVQVYNSITEAEGTWREFEAEGFALPYQTFDWVAAWYETLQAAAPTRPYLLAMYDDTGAPLMFVPLRLSELKRFGCRLRLVGWLPDHRAAAQLAPIMSPKAAELSAAYHNVLWQTVLDALPAAADVFRVRNQPATIYGLDNPCYLPELGMSEHARCHQTRLGPDWDTYLRSRTSRGRRKDSRRRLRRLGEIGDVEFRNVEDSVDCQPAIDAMFRQKRQWLAEIGYTDPFVDDCYDEFYREVTRRCKDMVRLSVLQVADEIVATDWGVARHGTFHSIMNSYEGGTWRQFSPSRLLLEWVLRQCSEDGIDVFDFSIGDGEYKADWCETSIPLFRADLPLSLTGRLALASLEIKREVGRYLVRGRRRLRV